MVEHNRPGCKQTRKAEILSIPAFPIRSLFDSFTKKGYFENRCQTLAIF